MSACSIERHLVDPFKASDFIIWGFCYFQGYFYDLCFYTHSHLVALYRFFLLVFPLFIHQIFWLKSILKSVTKTNVMCNFCTDKGTVTDISCLLWWTTSIHFAQTFISRPWSIHWNVNNWLLFSLKHSFIRMFTIFFVHNTKEIPPLQCVLFHRYRNASLFTPGEFTSL